MNVSSSKLRFDVSSWMTRAVLALCAATAFAQTEFQTGNAAFEKGEFDDAAKAYERSIQEGAAGANVFFNLGNAYERAGDNGRAVLNYQRALALRPGHPEAAANLAYMQRSQNIPVPSVRAWSNFVEWMGLDAIAIVTAGGAWMLLAGIVLRFGPWQRATAAWLLVLAGAIPLGIGSFILYSQRGGARNPDRAIVVSQDGTTAHYAPADNSRDVQVLPAGSEVRLLQDRGNWLYIEVANGVRGWVAAGDVDTVVPRGSIQSGG